MSCALRLAACELPDSHLTHVKRAIEELVEEVAAKLDDTPAICRKSYVNPVVLEAFTQGDLARETLSSHQSGNDKRATRTKDIELTPDEAETVKFLFCRLNTLIHNR